jgi:hypothetical protein
MTAIYVDKCLIIESDEGIKEVIEDLKNHDFGLQIEEYLKYYLSYHVKIDKEYGVAWIQQPHLINNLKAKFGEEVIAIQVHGTPGTVRFKIVRTNDEDKMPVAS